MDDLRVKAAIDARMAIYRKKQARMDPFEDDSQTHWESFQRCLEAMEWLAYDLGIKVAIPTDDCEAASDSDTRPKDGDAKHD